jgi:DNA-binding transcriptional LysR family regulator
MEGNLSQYHVFMVTAQTGSISGVAKKLYLTQPAVSRSVQTLEKSMGTSLFVRGPRGVSLTEDGLLLYRHVSQALQALEAGESELHRRGQMGMGHITIGVSTTLCRYRLLPYLKTFTRIYPHIGINILCQPTIENVRLLQAGTIDIGLVARHEELEKAAQVQFHSLGRIEDIFVSTPDYLQNLKKRYDKEGYDLLEAGTLLLLDQANATRQYIDYYLEEHHIHPQQKIESTTMDLLIEFARTGLGISCVIRQFIEEDLRRGSLVEIPLPDKISAREIGFAWRQEEENSRALQAFVDFLRQTRL